MKVIYKRSIVDQVIDANIEAGMNHQEIDHIELTESEAIQLSGETQIMYHPKWSKINPPPKEMIGMVDGVNLVVV